MSLLIGTPFFLVFGWLSDKIGRKWIIMAGCLLAIWTYFPLFKALDRCHDFRLNQSKIMTAIYFNRLERDFSGKPLHTFPHPALALRPKRLIPAEGRKRLGRNTSRRLRH